VNPATCASLRDLRARRLSSGGEREPSLPDDDHAGCSGGSAGITTAAIPQKTRALEKATIGTACRIHQTSFSQADAGRNFAPKVDSRTWTHSSAGKLLSPATSSVSNAGRKKSEIGNPNREEDPQTGRQAQRPWFRTELRTDPVFLGLQKTRYSTHSVASRHERSSGRLSRQWMHGMPRQLRE